MGVQAGIALYRFAVKILYRQWFVRRSAGGMAVTERKSQAGQTLTLISHWTKPRTKISSECESLCRFQLPTFSPRHTDFFSQEVIGKMQCFYWRSLHLPWTPLCK